MLVILKSHLDSFTNIPSNIRTGIFRLWCLASILFVLWMVAMLLQLMSRDMPEFHAIGSALLFLLVVSFCLVPPLLLYLIVLTLMWVADGFMGKNV